MKNDLSLILDQASRASRARMPLEGEVGARGVLEQELPVVAQPTAPKLRTLSSSGSPTRIKLWFHLLAFSTLDLTVLQVI